jgi:hypothetical protein
MGRMRGYFPSIITGQGKGNTSKHMSKLAMPIANCANWMERNGEGEATSTNLSPLARPSWTGAAPLAS